jgi:hypothetical protein
MFEHHVSALLGDVLEFMFVCLSCDSRAHATVGLLCESVFVLMDWLWYPELRCSQRLDVSSTSAPVKWCIIFLCREGRMEDDELGVGVRGGARKGVRRPRL